MMRTGFEKKFTKWLGLILLVPVLFLPSVSWSEGLQDDDNAVAPKFSPEAAATFSKRCTACHTYGKGIKVGPDLKGVNDRRKRDWLLKFVHASSIVIKSGDPTATALFAQFKQQRMPDWTDLSDKQISDILEYIAVGGPDIKPADERNAETATATQIQLGRHLFYGETPSKYGTQACATCHSVSDTGMRGGALGPDLTNIYLRYQDLALTAFLRHPCFSWAADSSTPYLAAKESFAIKAFLRSAALGSRAGETETKTSSDRSSLYGDQPPSAVEAKTGNNLSATGGKHR